MTAPKRRWPRYGLHAVTAVIGIIILAIPNYRSVGVGFIVCAAFQFVAETYTNRTQRPDPLRLN